jgi:hypothetical protein
MQDPPEQPDVATEAEAPELGDEEPIDDEPAPLDEAAELDELRKLKADIDGDHLPETLLDKQVKVQVNGREMAVTVAEAAQGYMRTVDYSRKLNEVTQIREQGQAMQSGAKLLLQDLNAPESLLAAAKHLGFKKSLVEAAKIIAKERLALAQLPPEARQYALQLEEERDAREYESRERQRLQERLQEREAKEPNEEQVHMRRQLDQLVPRAFAKHKLGDYPLAQQLFSSNLQNMWTGQVSPEVIDAAARATSEQLADIASKLPPATAKTANGQPLPARRAAPAAGKPVVRRQSGTTTDFAQHLDRLIGR